MYILTKHEIDLIKEGIVRRLYKSKEDYEEALVDVINSHEEMRKKCDTVREILKNDVI